MQGKAERQVIASYCEEFQRRSCGSEWLRNSCLEGGIGISSGSTTTSCFEDLSQQLQTNNPAFEETDHNPKILDEIFKPLDDIMRQLQ